MAFNPNLILPDISFYQNSPSTIQSVDFQKMKAAGAAGVILRAGQNTWIDPEFNYFYLKAKEAGLPRGVYWFYDSRSPAFNQANLFMDIVGDRDGMPEIGWWLDLEENYGGSYRGWKNWKAFLERMRLMRPGQNHGVYTSPAYWTRNRPTEPTDLPFFGQFPLWIANYGVLQPSIPAPWTVDKTWFWQYTSAGDGTVYGVESKEIDLNRFNGTAEEFFKKFGGVVPPPTGDTVMQYGKVNTSALNVRSGPGASYADLGDLLKDDYLVATEVIGGWWHLTDARRGGWSGGAVELASGATVAERATATNDVWCSGAYVVLVDPPPPPPPAGNKAFSLKVDGYKTFDGVLEPE